MHVWPLCITQVVHRYTAIHSDTHQLGIHITVERSVIRAKKVLTLMKPDKTSLYSIERDMPVYSMQAIALNEVEVATCILVVVVVVGGGG